MALSQGVEAVLERSEADVYLAASVEADFLTRRRYMHVLGAVAVEGAMNPEHEAAEEASLPAVAEDYFSEDPEKRANAQARLGNDIRTSVFEILCESGHVSFSHSDRRPDGFYQNGYSQRAMFAHGTLHTDHPVEYRRRGAETLTELRIEDGDDAGRFRTHYLLEESRPPADTDMPDEVAKEHGYNTQTRKAMLRLTEVDENGHRITASAPVYGVDKAGHRRDHLGVHNIHETLQTGLAGASPTEGLENAVWIHKSLIPNGIVDVVKLYDEGVDGNSFFGVEGQDGNYDTIVEESLRREQQAERDLDDKVHKLALELQGFRREEDCVAALMVMANHAKDFAAELCVQNDSYDSAQFGPESAYNIELSRHYAKQGDIEASERALQIAKETALVYICGVLLDAKQAADEGDPSQKKVEDCEFTSQKCPICGEKNAKTKVRNGVYEHVGKGCSSKPTITATLLTNNSKLSLAA